MDCYHGTDKPTALSLVAGAIDVSKGGGELGMGFYAGEYLWVAKSWAANRFKHQATVVKLEISDDDYFGLHPLLLSRTDALNHRNRIKADSTTRTHKFNVHVVWSPIVGITRVDADQHKFESQTLQSLLNSKKVQRGTV